MRQAVLDMRRHGQHVRQAQLVQCQQHVDGALITLPDRRRWLAADHPLIAEILNNQETLIEIGVIDLRRREAMLPQAICHRHERTD